MVQRMPAFAFVLDYLHPLPVQVRHFFGGHAVYLHDTLLLVLWDKAKTPESNGIWVATTRQHHVSLQATLPALQNIELFEAKAGSNWRLLPVASDSFEEDARALCALIQRGDVRIGRVAKPRKLLQESPSE